LTLLGDRRLIIGIVGLAIILMLTVSVVLFTKEVSRIREEKTKRASIMGELPDFSLTNQTRTRVGRSDLLSRINIVNFIFTHCEGPCPALTSQMVLLQKDWVSVPDVQFVTITVDPERDSPDVLARYTEQRKIDTSRWHFLTGESDRVFDLIKNGFRADLKESDGSHEVMHSLRFALVDRKGRIRAYLDGESKDLVANLRPMVRRLLAEN
jgi:protein SCO1/2